MNESSSSSYLLCCGITLVRCVKPRIKFLPAHSRPCSLCLSALCAPSLLRSANCSNHASSISAHAPLQTALLGSLESNRRRNGGGGGAAADRAGRSGLVHPSDRRLLSRGGKRRREWRGDQAAEGVPRLPDQAQACRLRRRRRGALVCPPLSSKSTFFLCLSSVQFIHKQKKSGFFPFVSWG
jgi:hypothetical protein